MSKTLKPGCIYWFDYLHLDQAKEVRRSTDSSGSVVFEYRVPGKSRPALVLCRKGETREYRIIKITTAKQQKQKLSKEEFEERYLSVGRLFDSRDDSYIERKSDQFYPSNLSREFVEELEPLMLTLVHEDLGLEGLGAPRSHGTPRRVGEFLKERRVT